VQTQQGKWLSIFGKVLHEHVVAASETYNTQLELRLTEAIGVQFTERPAHHATSGLCERSRASTSRCASDGRSGDPTS
jgi:hypothetical protein